MSIFKAYDIRGVYGQDLDDAVFYRIARAYARFCGFSGKGRVVVARDCRKSSDALFAAFSQGLVDEGVDVIDIGLASTPMSYFANSRLKADGSVMITASHNTKEWNGCKLCRANAVPISGATGIKDIERLVGEIGDHEPPAGVGEVTKVDVSSDYAAHVKTFAHMKRPLHLALDFANGTGIAEAAAFVGSDITYDSLYGEYDGDFPNHDANPLHRETLRDLQALMRANPGKYAFGVAYDGDADRAGFLDENGEIIPMDFVTALISQDLLAANPGAACLYDLRSSKVCEETIAAAGGKPVMSRVGHSFIKAQMRENDAIFAGELSGHYYFKANSQAALRPDCAAEEVFAVGRDKHQDDDSARRGARARQGHVRGQGEGAGARRRHHRRLGGRGLVGERPHVEHRAARPPQPGGPHHRDDGGQARRVPCADQELTGLEA